MWWGRGVIALSGLYIRAVYIITFAGTYFFDNEAVDRGDLIINTSCRVMSVIVSFRTSARIQELIVR